MTTPYLIKFSLVSVTTLSLIQTLPGLRDNPPPYQTLPGLRDNPPPYQTPPWSP